jgi:hypothetical protein
MTETSAVLAPLMGICIDHFGFSFSFTLASVAAAAVTLACWPFLRGSQD